MNRLSPILLVLLLVAATCTAQRPIEVRPLPEPRNLHGSVVVGDYLFVISGDLPQPKGFTPSILTAKINADHSLGEWFENKPLPINLIYITNNVMVLNDSFYVCGGQEAKDIPGAANPGSEYLHEANNSAIFARVGADGRIGEWKRSGRYASDQGEGSAAATDGRFLYITGGASNKDGALSSRCFFAAVLPDGSVGPWKETSPLPAALWAHNAYCHNGTVYTFGGLTSREPTSASNLVFTSQVREDGTLDPWITSPMKLSYPVSVASACAADDFLFLFCGRAPSTNLLEQIQFSRLTALGISNWTPVPTNISTRIYASAALDRKRRAIYLTGGRSTASYTSLNDRVFFYPLRPTDSVSPPPAAQGTLAFSSYDQALQRAASEKKNILLYVYASNIEFTRQELANLSSSKELAPVAQKVVLASRDVAQDPSYAQRAGLIRMPSYLLLSPKGDVLKKQSGVRSAAQLASMVE